MAGGREEPDDRLHSKSTSKSERNGSSHRRREHRDRGTDRESKRSRSRGEHASRRGDSPSKRAKDSERERSKEKEKSRERERDRARSKDRDAERELDRDRDRDDDRVRGRGDQRVSRSERERGRHRDDKQLRDDRDAKVSERKGPSASDRDAKPQREKGNAERDARAVSGVLPKGLSRERQEMRVKEMSEQEKIEMERRRKVEAWQAKKRELEAKQAREQARQEEEEAAAAAAHKKWSLEDDGSDEEVAAGKLTGEAHVSPTGAKEAAPMDADDADPLDAFMADVTTEVIQDLAALGPEAAKEALDESVNPALARAGIALPDTAEPRGAEASGAAAEQDGEAGGAAPPARREPEGDVGDARGSGGRAQAVEQPAAAPLDTVMAEDAGEAGGADDKPKTGPVERAPGAAAAAAPVAIRRGKAREQANGKTASGPPDVKAKKRQARLHRARERRAKAIARAAPKAGNPYGSDDSGAEESGEDGEESDVAGGGDEAAELDDEEWAKAVQSGRISKGERLTPVDHSTIAYPAFRKVFYIESPEIRRMSDADVAALRAELGGIKVRGRDPPRPLRNWAQCGLSMPIMQVLRRHGYTEPLPIQAQALPVIMSGRDCIGVATTGSGKTLAFVLPMLRHIADQVQQGLDDALGNGPVGLIVAPTRELVQQISREIRVFCKPLGLACCAAYGGSQVKEQISELKRGVHVVVCTPGRMIDILVMSNGTITNLRRVTMLVIDEADRMFDMGFEPQVARIIGQVRPDRQTVLFSATFPRQVEALARTILNEPIEIQVGARSTVSTTINQLIELRDSEEERFARLLELLSEWGESGKILVFVNSQDKASTLFQKLLNYGHPNQMLHGDMQQTDRESVISDFKSGVCSVLVATSVAARGLDVRDLVLVINYDTPNHLEEYVHRCGRTGRAGAAGTAVTFVAPADDQYAPDLVKALKDAKKPVPADLQRLAAGFADKRKKGLARAHGSGFGGSGFRFDVHEDDAYEAVKKRHAIEWRRPEDDDAEDGAASAAAAAAAAAAIAAGEGGAAAAAAAAAAASGTGPRHLPEYELPAEVAHVPEEQRVRAQQIAIQAASRLAAAAAQRNVEDVGGGIRRVVPTPSERAARSESRAAIVMAAQSAASSIATGLGMRQNVGQAAKLQAMQIAAQRSSKLNVSMEYYESELMINDFPQSARFHVTHRDTLAQINERTGAAVIIKGYYYAPGQHIPPGESKLYLLIEGPTAQHVKRAKDMIKQIIEERTEKSMRKEAGAMGRFQIA